MKPYWPKTMQLLPAHLHARDGYLEDLLATRAERRIPHVYGLLELELDEAALGKGDIVVRSLEAIFPSGAAAHVEPMAPLQRALAPGGTDGAVDVYVALPLPVVRGPNVSEAGGPVRSTRFVAPRPKDDADLPAMRTNPEILFEGERLEGFEVLRIGRARYFGKSVRLERDALPTALHVRASGALYDGLRALLQVIDGRRKELVRYRVDHPMNLGAVVAAELPALQLSVALHRYAPVLAELAARRSAHPHELYDVLVALHGALLAFAQPEIAPSYDHDDQGRMFPWLFERVTRLADESARDRTTVLPFQRVDDVTFRLSFQRADLVGKRPLLVLQGPDEGFLRERVPSLLKMASPSGITSLLHSALRGVPIAEEFEPPPVVPRRQGVVAYRIDVRDKHWLDIEDRMQIQLHLAGAPPGIEAFLYAVERLAQTVQ
jgi:type VI secretion system protein ImpJ